MRMWAMLLMLTSASVYADIIDRIGVTVGDSVITMNEIVTQVRVAALIDGRPLKLDEASLRQAADRLVEQTLIRREMALGEYASVPANAVDSVLENLKKEHFLGTETAYREALRQYGISEEDLKEQLLWQLILLRFIDLRFKPGVQVPAEDVRAYYRETFVPQWQKTTTAPPPTIGQARERIEEALTQQQLDNLLDRWLNSARTQIPIVFRDTAFREAAEAKR